MVDPNWGLLGNGPNALSMFQMGNQLGQQARQRQDEQATKNALATILKSQGGVSGAPGVVGGFGGGTFGLDGQQVTPANSAEEGWNKLIDADPRMAMQYREQQQTSQRAELEKRLKIVGNAAQWADTPQKWDAAIDHLSRTYPDLAEYKGQFSPEARMAAISAGGDVDAFLKRMEPVNVGPGSHLVDPMTGEAKFSAPFAPRPVTVKEGEKVVEYAPGVQGGGNADDIFTRMIGAESNGQQFAPNGSPLTSPAGAIGIAQVMPGTAPEAAQLAGLPFDENRYRTDPEYNAALGKAYFEKQLQDFGDPALAVAAYNAGPGAVRKAVARGGDNWIANVPPETQNYVRKVMGGEGGARVIADGGPKQSKPQWRRLSPQEVEQAGLPPGVYQQAPDGEIKPVSGTTGKNAPAAKEAYSQSAIDAFDRAITSGKGLLTHEGLSAAVGAKGITGGLLGGWVMPGTDAADFATNLETMKSQVFLPMVQSMKGMGALSNAEGAKLTAAIGNLDTSQSETQFKKNVQNIINDLTTYRNRSAAPRQGASPQGGKKPSVSNW